MIDNRLIDYLDHMRQAASDACSFIEGMSKHQFLTDKRTQQAVILSLIVIGEAATKVMDQHPEFASLHPAYTMAEYARDAQPHRAHGYFDINLEVVWDTVQTALPELLEKLREI